MRGLLNLLLFGSSVMEMNNGLVILERAARLALTGVVVFSLISPSSTHYYPESCLAAAFMPIVRHPANKQQFSIAFHRAASANYYRACANLTSLIQSVRHNFAGIYEGEGVGANAAGNVA